MKGKSKTANQGRKEGFPKDLKAAIERRKEWLKNEPDLVNTKKLLYFGPDGYDTAEFAALQRLSEDELRGWIKNQEEQPTLRMGELPAIDFPNDLFDEFLEYVNGMYCDTFYLMPKQKKPIKAVFFKIAQVRECLLTRLLWEDGRDPNIKPSPDEISPEQIKAFISDCKVQKHRAICFINRRPIFFRHWFEGLDFHKVLEQLRVHKVPSSYIFHILSKEWEGLIPNKEGDKWSAAGQKNIAYWVNFKGKYITDDGLKMFMRRATAKVKKHPPKIV